MVVAQLILYVITFVLFSRVLSFVGLPVVINFLHFPLVLLLSMFVLIKSKRAIVYQFLFVCFIFISFILLSALINEGGLINVFLDFLLLVEPLLFVFCIFSIKWSEASIIKFRRGLLFIVVVHLLFILFQRFVLGYVDDDVEGILLNMGAGAHLSGAIALSSAIYFLLYSHKKYGMTSIKYKAIYLPFVLLLMASVIFSDAKQVIAAFLLALGLLLFVTRPNLKRASLLLAAIFFTCLILYIISLTVFPGLQAWLGVALLEEGLTQKLSVFYIIHNSYDSPLNYFFGLGPGHSVGRLGMLLPDYANQLSSFGATSSSLTSEVWEAHQGHFMSNSTTGSSMFSLFFSWAGVFGDLGVLGLSLYVYMYYLVWKVSSVDVFSKFLILTIFIFGWIFQWMEEPQYMLFTMCLIGLRWQENQLEKHAQANNYFLFSKARGVSESPICP